jgi:hypothetical protein
MPIKAEKNVTKYKIERTSEIFFGNSVSTFLLDFLKRFCAKAIFFHTPEKILGSRKCE